MNKEQIIREYNDQRRKRSNKILSELFDTFIGIVSIMMGIIVAILTFFGIMVLLILTEIPVIADLCISVIAACWSCACVADYYYNSLKLSKHSRR